MSRLSGKANSGRGGGGRPVGHRTESQLAGLGGLQPASSVGRLSCQVEPGTVWLSGTCLTASGSISYRSLSVAEDSLKLCVM